MPFPVKVVVAMDSDKFTFPDGRRRTLVLQRPTTPVRIQARSLTSGDRLPVEVTLTTPDGQLVIAWAALHRALDLDLGCGGRSDRAGRASSCWSWWGRTWRKGRRRRPRASLTVDDRLPHPPRPLGRRRPPRSRPPPPTWRSAPGSRGSPVSSGSWPWPGRSASHTWPTPSTWPIPPPTCSTTSCWAACSRPRSSRSLSTSCPTAPRRRRSPPFRPCSRSP